jgi:hypothetical protein
MKHEIYRRDIMDEKLTVMISSRCNDKVICKDNEELLLTDLRKFLKKELEKEQMLGFEYLDVLINETMKLNVADDALEVSLKAIIDADIILVLYNGNAGWVEKGSGGEGVCQAEFAEAFSNNPAKTSVIDFLRTENKKALKFSHESGYIDYDKMKDIDLHKEFQRYYDGLHPISQKPPEPENLTAQEYKEEILKIAGDLLFNAFIQVYKTLNVSKVKFVAGEALNWSKMNYTQRANAIEAVIKKSINENSKFKNLIYDLSIVPDAMSVAEARTMGGRPFLDNYLLVDDPGQAGKEKAVINFMGVYKNATENQMRAVIGHPDITIIKGDFGFYVWDMINQIQLITLINCRDSSATRKQLTHYYNWVDESGEWKNMLTRARKRYNILKAIKDNQ